MKVEVDKITSVFFAPRKFAAMSAGSPALDVPPSQHRNGYHCNGHHGS